MTRDQQQEAMLVEAHRLAFEKLRTEPAQIHQVKAVLERWRLAAGEEVDVPRWQEWRALLELGVKQIEVVLNDSTNRGARLRKSSPFPFLLCESERMALRGRFGLPVAPLPVREHGCSLLHRTP